MAAAATRQNLSDTGHGVAEALKCQLCDVGGNTNNQKDMRHMNHVHVHHVLGWEMQHKYINFALNLPVTFLAARRAEPVRLTEKTKTAKSWCSKLRHLGKQIDLCNTWTVDHQK